MARPVVIRRLGIAVGSVVALTATFVLGVVAGAGSRPDSEHPAGAGVLDDAASAIEGSALQSVDRATLDAAAIKAMLGAAGDPWGSWADSASGTGPYTGVGLWIRSDGGTLRVSRVADGSPAARNGVEVGDELRAVDDRTTRGLLPSEVAASLRGLPGTTVTLVLRRGTALRSLALTRTEVSATGVTTSRITPHVARIVVPVFGRGAGREVRDALIRLRGQGVTGIVLDLRGDPGGLLSEAVETASAFLDGGPVVRYTRRGDGPRELDAGAPGDTRTALVVLVDGGTASAAEVVAGALQDRGRAVVVGSRTFGKGSVQEPHRLSDGSSLDLTVARYTLPSGRSVEGVGIEPDIEVAPTDSADAVVRRAVEVLSGLRADAGGLG